MLMQNWRLLECEAAHSALVPAEDWAALAARSVALAGLSRPELVVPLLASMPAAVLHTVRAGGDLLLAMPVQSRRLPPIFSNWVTPLTPGGAFHLDREQGPAAVSALLRKLGRPLLLQGVPADGPFIETIKAGAAHVAVVENWRRAALRPRGGFEEWAEANLDKKRRKEYRRLKARLVERGRFEVMALAPGADVQPFAAALLDLEAAGWKGQRGTAIKSGPKLVAAFHEICARLHAAGALRFWRMSLDGRPIASLYAIVEGDCCWLGKIAYDESFAKYSPGVLLILEATGRLFAEPGIALVDSCAIPDHPMIDRIWRDRVGVADVLVADAGVGTARFAVLAAAERLRRKARAKARDLLHAVTGRRRS